MIEEDGQDGVVASHTDPAPPARGGPKRGTEPVYLRMRPDEVLILKSAWKASGVATLSSFVAQLVAANGDLGAIVVQRDALVDVSRLAAAAAQAPSEVRRLRIELMRLGGVLQSLFVRAESMEAVKEHASACAETLNALRDAAEQTEAELKMLHERLAPLRAEFAHAVSELAGRP